MYLKFQSTERMGDAFKEVALSVGKIIQGVYVPGVAGAMVAHFQDAVHQGIPEVHVGMGHIDLGP